MLELSERTPLLPGQADGRLKTLIRKTISDGPSGLDTQWAKTEFPDFASYKAEYIAHEGLLHTLAMEGALFAPVIDIALTHRPQRNPYGLIYFPTRNYAHDFLPTDPSTIQVLTSFEELRNNQGIYTNPFNILYIASTDTLRAASDELVEVIEEKAQKSPSSLGSQTYHTYTDFRKPFDKHVDHKHKGIREDLHRGSDTAAMVDAGILKAVPEVATKIYKLDAQEPDFNQVLKEIAKNSEGFMTEITQLDKRSVVWLQDHVFYPFLTRNHDNGLHYFRFSQSQKTGKISLDFTDEVRKELEKLKEKYKDNPVPRYGCPLATAIDKPSPTDPSKTIRESGIQEFWKWNYTLGCYIYDKEFPQAA